MALTPEEEVMGPGPRQLVPTRLAIAPDGTTTLVFLSDASSGPSVLDYQPHGSYTVRAADPISMTVNTAYGPNRLLYLSQLTADFSGEMPAPGAVVRIEADSTATPGAEGVFFVAMT
jgi:hypothetical protein